jgi:hypothetical protein
MAELRRRILSCPKDDVSHWSAHFPLVKFACRDLSHNGFTGRVPDLLVSLPKLTQLWVVADAKFCSAEFTYFASFFQRKLLFMYTKFVFRELCMFFYSSSDHISWSFISVWEVIPMWFAIFTLLSRMWFLDWTRNLSHNQFDLQSLSTTTTQVHSSERLLLHTSQESDDSSTKLAEGEPYRLLALTMQSILPSPIQGSS